MKFGDDPKVQCFNCIKVSLLNKMHSTVVRREIYFYKFTTIFRCLLPEICLVLDLFLLLKGRLQILPLILANLSKSFNFSCLTKSLENLWFSDDFRGNRS